MTASQVTRSASHAGASASDRALARRLTQSSTTADNAAAVPGAAGAGATNIQSCFRWASGLVACSSRAAACTLNCKLHQPPSVTRQGKSPGAQQCPAGAMLHPFPELSTHLICSVFAAGSGSSSTPGGGSTSSSAAAAAAAGNGGASGVGAPAQHYSQNAVSCRMLAKCDMWKAST